MAKMVLVPWQETLVSEGKVFYCEGMRAWNIIRLKTQLLDELPLLREKRAKVSYRIEHPRTIQNFKKILERIEKEGKPLPFLLQVFLDEPLK
ncbi:MAG: hypothetical protein V1743_07180 [Nanoarchaeota archaeon]